MVASAAFSFLRILLIFVSVTRAQISMVNGQPQFSGTQVAIAPASQPTLIYNCGKLPAICSNVAQRNQLGTTFDLHFDKNANRKRARRNTACPTRWKFTHSCPEGNQPDTVGQGDTLGQGSFPARPYGRTGLTQGAAGWNRIADATGVFSGMMWTCDEWPAASFIEGGVNANTYCAPQNSKCARQPGVRRDSEQDFQGRAHGILRRSAPDSIFRFRFSTIYSNLRNDPATYVEWIQNGARTWTGVQKRDAFDDDDGSNATVVIDSYNPPTPDQPFRVRHSMHNNGTETIEYFPLTEEERELHRRRLEGSTLSRRQEDIPPNASIPSTQQQFERLPQAPPLPIIDIAREFIAALDGEMEVTSYIESVLESSNAGNGSEQSNGTAAAKKLSLNNKRYIHEPTSSNGLSLIKAFLQRRQQKRQCDPSNPCPDNSCCTKAGRCGFGKANCDLSVCISNCNATALCGRDSEGGKVKCPLNVCCSDAGYCGVEQDYCTGTQNVPCQQGFGSCEIIPPPSCGGNSAASRSIGYYQLANVRDRQCNRIGPKDIDIKGLTHLYAAFATIDPSTFEVGPAHPDDLALYKEFTGRKSSTLETWIAIGGWDFNDPGATRTTFSDLSRTAARRSRFITSLKNFLTTHGFQGVDIDWEYPGAPDRGGVKEDTDNYVALLREMRASFGTQFGISIAIPSSYWYLRWFKPKEMQQYVDWFGIMTYDLHGPWDEKVSQIGKFVIGHTNIPEIYNWTQPLWYDGVDPAKVNMGLAYYARGYTVSDSNCNAVGCSWSGTSRPAPCTNFGGVMSLQEIENQIIPQLGVQPHLLEKDMMMELKWGNQWIGYDNKQTIAMKKTWASQHCFGGTMIWSVDFYSGSGSGDTPDGGGSTHPGNPGQGNPGDGSGNVYIDPSIYKDPNPVVYCEPPCTLILPPLVLSTSTTIKFPPYTTSLDVAWSASTGWTSIVQTTVLTIPPVTTTEIEVWAYTVTDTRTSSGVYSSFDITPSIRPPPFTITNDPDPLDESTSHPLVTRTITPPPYPYTYTPTEANPTTTTTSNDVGLFGLFPTPTWKPGKPGPLCKSKCGRPCLLFCNRPCLLDCTDAPNDFPDPKNPNPPPRPKPNPTPPNKPKPTFPPNPEPSRKPNPDGDEPNDEEEEDNDRECAIEFDLPIPTFRSNEPDPSTTIKPPSAPPPTSSPSPPPDPPKPNPKTEKVDCYNSGATVTRGMMIDALNDFCGYYEGIVLDASKPDTLRTLTNEAGFGAHCFFLGCFDIIKISVTVINGCKFTMGGKGANQECGRILRRAIDECDKSSTDFKQGGTIESNCAQWRIDPNVNWE